MAKSDLKKLLQSTDKAELISLFFKYMVESFGIDTITSCLKGVLPATSEIVNPEYKELIAGQKKVSTLLKDCKVKYTETSLVENQLLEKHTERYDRGTEKKMERYILKKASIQEEIEALEKEC